MRLQNIIWLSTTECRYWRRF